MTYEVVNVTPDTPEWEAERRKSIGASEVAGVLGISPYMTPLSVYRSKHGVDEPFDPERAYVGHAAEVLVEGWVRKFRPELGDVGPAVMVRSTVTPWLHASLDRTLGGVPLQIKSAHFYGVKDWQDGTPLLVQAQIQAEIHCFDAPHAYAAVMGGDMKVRLHRVERDQAFIDDYLIPATRTFWREHVLADVAPEPTTLAEVADVWPSEDGKVIVGSDLVLEAAARRAVLFSDVKALEDEAKALTLAIAQYLQTAEVLTDQDGNRVLTYKTQQGKRGVTDLDALEAAHPEFVKRGTPFKVVRHVSPNETK